MTGIVFGKKSVKDFCLNFAQNIIDRIFVQNIPVIWLNWKMFQNLFSIFLNQVLKFTPNNYTIPNRLKQRPVVEQRATLVLICTLVLIWIVRLILRQSIHRSNQSSPLQCDNNIPQRVIYSGCPISPSHTYISTRFQSTDHTNHAALRQHRQMTWKRNPPIKPN